MGTKPVVTVDDELLGALDEFEEAFDETCDAGPEISQTSDSIRQHRQRGRPLAEIVASGNGRLMATITRVLNRLNAAGTRLRRAQVDALRDEGLSTSKIASILGVTRQRVSALLRGRRPDHAP